MTREEEEVALDQDTEEYQDNRYFSFWDLWIGVGSQVAEDIAYALWLEFLTGTLSENMYQLPYILETLK